MIDDKWEDWTEPLEVILGMADRFTATLKKVCVRIHNLPENRTKIVIISRGKLIESPKIYTRKEDLAKALSNMLWVPQKIWTTDFLDNYIYASDIYKDTFDLVFEYIGENEHQFDLHGEEFAQTVPKLLEDFALYLFYWQSPHVKR